LLLSFFVVRAARCHVPLAGVGAGGVIGGLFFLIHAVDLAGLRCKHLHFLRVHDAKNGVEITKGPVQIII
jgi:hypothetical protein